MRRACMTKVTSAISRLVLLCLLLAFGVTASAQEYERISEYEQNLYGAKAHVTGDFETMRGVKRAWVQEAMRLKGRNYEFSLCGNSDGILKVTIPARLLFQQEDSLLSVQGDGILRPFLRLLRGDSQMASVIVSCHSDNNGSSRYLNAFTASRARCIQRWMEKQGVSKSDITCYGIGSNVPRTDNSNIAMRERNRRVTLYFIPNKRMLKEAKKN